MNTVQISTESILFVDRVEAVIRLLDKATGASTREITPEESHELTCALYAFQLENSFLILLYSCMLRSFVDHIRNGASPHHAVHVADVPFISNYDRAYYCSKIPHIPMLMNDMVQLGIIYGDLSFEDHMDKAARYMLIRSLEFISRRYQTIHYTEVTQVFP